MTRRVRCWTTRSFALAIVAALAAMGCGGDNGTQPLPCDTYAGGDPAGLPGTYNLISFCQGAKPDRAATGPVTLTTDLHFDASITSGGQTTTFNGSYHLGKFVPDSIYASGQVNGSSVLFDFAGTFSLNNNTLSVGGRLTVQSSTQAFSFIATKP